MVHSARFTCVLDTCVKYPIDVRDVSLWFAHFELYRPKWSQTIFDELRKVMIEKGMPDQQATKPARARCVHVNQWSHHYRYCVPSPTGPRPITCASVCPIACTPKYFSWSTQDLCQSSYPGVQTEF